MKNQDLLARLRQFRALYGNIGVRIEAISPDDIARLDNMNYVNITNVASAVTSVVVTGSSASKVEMKVDDLITALDALDDTYGVARLTEKGRACVNNVTYIDSTMSYGYNYLNPMKIIMLN
jgi:hypothetical protein